MLPSEVNILSECSEILRWKERHHGYSLLVEGDVVDGMVNRSEK